jgi:predicted enzyme related to lactoylglutathione lyase
MPDREFWKRISWQSSKRNYVFTKRPSKIFVRESQRRNTMAEKTGKMNSVVHFEMPAEDRKRMAGFYASVFGWKTQMLGPEMGDYVLATTTEVDEKTGRPKMPGAINGGFFQKSNDKPGQYPSVVIAVEDIKEHMKKVEKAGGKVLGEPWDIPGVGLYVSFIDTEGNRVSMLQPSMPQPRRS